MPFWPYLVASAVVIDLFQDKQPAAQPASREPALRPEAHKIVMEILQHAEYMGMTPYGQWDDAKESYLRDYRNSLESHEATPVETEQAIEAISNEVEDYLLFLEN